VHVFEFTFIVHLGMTQHINSLNYEPWYWCYHGMSIWRNPWSL